MYNKYVIIRVVWKKIRCRKYIQTRHGEIERGIQLWWEEDGSSLISKAPVMDTSNIRHCVFFWGGKCFQDRLLVWIIFYILVRKKLTLAGSVMKKSLTLPDLIKKLYWSEEKMNSDFVNKSQIDKEGWNSMTQRKSEGNQMFYHLIIFKQRRPMMEILVPIFKIEKLFF